MKIFWSVLAALIAFSALCGLGFFVYQDNAYQAKVDKCVNNMNKLIIQKGDYDLLTSMKTKILKECREANE